MCELLGINFNHPVRPAFSFPSLLKGCWRNWDGWGIGFYPEGSKSVQIFKEPYTGITSDLAAFLQNYNGLHADLFIAHIRKSSRGDNVFHNTHPFSKCYGSREWVFAHNGTIPKKKLLQRQTFFPVGDTDSEHAFCTLLSLMKQKRIKSATRSKYNGFNEQDIDIIYETLLEINGTCKGTFNCLLSDGVYLFCFRDIRGARKLSYLHREYPFSATTLRNCNFKIDLQVAKGGNDRGYVIATEPLSSEDWIPFRYGEMIVFRGGEIVARRNTA